MSSFWDQTLTMGLPKALDGYFGGGDVKATTVKPSSQAPEVQYIERVAPMNPTTVSPVFNIKQPMSAISKIDNKILIGGGILAAFLIFKLIK